jgi:predicted HTH domain antitoxin
MLNPANENMDISVTFPEELLIAARETPETFSPKVIIYTLGHLYEQGKISSGIGAEILGCNRWEFYRQLSEHGFSVIDLDPEELDAEAMTSREIAAQTKNS